MDFAIKILRLSQDIADHECRIAQGIQVHPNPSPKLGIGKRRYAIRPGGIGGSFQRGVKYDIIPCKAKDFVVQKRRFSLGNLI